MRYNNIVITHAIPHALRYVIQCYQSVIYSVSVSVYHIPALTLPLLTLYNSVT